MPPIRPLRALLVASCCLPLTLSAQSSADALIEKLVAKGILTAEEARELREESESAAASVPSPSGAMPDWLSDLRFEADFRGRFDGLHADHPAFPDRIRWRYRVRAGLTAVLHDRFEIGFRVASGDLDSAGRIESGFDPISSNQTFQNNAARKGIFLDTAFARWKALDGDLWKASVTFGKMDNPLELSDLLFDPDYTPEGLAQQVSYRFHPRHELKASAVQFVLDELGGSTRDPHLLGGQLRVKSKWNDRWSTAAGAAFLGILHEDQLTSSEVPDINTGNRREVIRSGDGETFTLGAPVADFETLVFDLALTRTFESAPWFEGSFPVTVFGEYLHNFGADDARHGYQAGVRLGRTGERGTWELSWRWKHLESDAWWEELTDSDSGAYYAGPFDPASVPDVLPAPGSGYGGGTNIRGHVLRLGYSPLDRLVVRLTWFRLELIDEFASGSDSDMSRVQVDALWNF